MLSFRHSVGPLFLLVVVLFVVGTAGYMLIEGWDWPDAFYMTAITLTTVGFGEVQPLSSLGRIFTVFIILSGVGTVAYGFGRALVDDTYLPGERFIIAPDPFIHIMPVKHPCTIIRFENTGSGHCHGCLSRAGLPHY